MQNHNLSPTLECDGALSDLILQAARQALPPNPEQLICIPPSGVRNGPLLPLLIGLINAAQATARAVGDNVWDDCHPIDANLAHDLARQCRAIADDIEITSQCPDALILQAARQALRSWSLPSATGTELV
jgi:hypothetical protein